MTEPDLNAEKDATTSAAENYWFGVLNWFPFIFIPLVIVVAIVCAIVMPILTLPANRP